MKTKPYNRHETFLAALTDSSVTVPTPLTREERYLAKIAGESVTIPDVPYNRYETYLAKLAGQDVTIPAPASRLETFLYKACGYKIIMPFPVSREEVFWSRYAGFDSSGKRESREMTAITDAADAKAKHISIDILPMQDGAGEPSSSNIRPITGWASISMRRTGKNLQGGSALIGDLYAMMPSAEVDMSENTIKYSSGTNSTEIQTIPFKEKTEYTVLITLKHSSGSNNFTNMLVRYTDGTFAGINKERSTEKQSIYNISDPSRTVSLIGKRNQGGSTVVYGDESGVFEGDISIDDFEVYKGATYTTDLSFAGTVYGGTLDFVNGILTVTHAYIESYNNEDLPGEWISSEDVYVPGTKPTVGAQVVYKLDEDDYEIYQIQPRDVEMLEGVNNIWSDAGPVSVTYIPDL